MENEIELYEVKRPDQVIVISKARSGKIFRYMMEMKKSLESGTNVFVYCDMKQATKYLHNLMEMGCEAAIFKSTGTTKSGEEVKGVIFIKTTNTHHETGKI